MRLVGSHITSGREKEGHKERMGKEMKWVGVDGRTILECILNNWVSVRGIQLIRLFISSPNLVSCTFLIAYSNASLDSSGDKVSSYFKPFSMGKLEDKYFPILILH